MSGLKVLHVSSEVAPWSKTGGLGDVVSALPRALAALARNSGREGPKDNDEQAVIAPAYQADAQKFGLARRLKKVHVPLGGRIHEVEVLEGRVPGGGGKVHAWLVDHPCFRRAGIYGEGDHEYPDNAFRFALFSRAALAVPREFGFSPDVIHGHDWPAGPALHYARHVNMGAKPTKTVMTIHNLAFQGLFSSEVASVVDFDPTEFTPEGYEFFGQASYIKAGLAAADRITTVSPRYSREILTEEYGFGLDGYLRSRAHRLSGILNGVDYDQWNPARDPALAEPYSTEQPGGKRACKAALQRQLGLPARPRIPLFGAVSRLSWQKGFDLVAEALERLLAEKEIQIIILGSGERLEEERLERLAARNPTKMVVRLGYDETLAHRIYAASDLYLMPSRYEPCGLGQLYALRYGAVPIVRATGGLDDTVVDYDPRSRTGTGFKFTAPDSPALEAAMRRALGAYSLEEDFAALGRRAMAQDFSWGASARGYRSLYQSLVGR